jgi:aspartate/methionine/tyrosine aminotransferase
MGIEPERLTAFRSVPRTGVIYVTTEAARRGFVSGSPEWSNLGQGQPETGTLPGAPPRHEQLAIDPADQEYAPVAGVWELREAVAGLYNALYRRGLPSQYSAENVAIAGGGRASLTRAAAALGNINLGHFLPDYTAYEELLEVFGMFSAIPVLLEASDGYRFPVESLRREILGRGLSAVLLSNPCNPTGKVVAGLELDRWVSTARELDCALLFDEFYSHYIWRKDLSPDGMVSAASHVEDVNTDPVVIFDGLTKNWRYPGWRCGWTIGPRSVIDAVTSAGSFLDGGGSRPLQYAATSLVTPEITRTETEAIRAAFGRKRTLMLKRLREIGFTVELEPEGTFYVWASLESLPPPLDDGMAFFRAALDRKVICVPGEFFDVNPGKRRRGRASRFRRHVRFSFGPSEQSVADGLDRIAALVAEHRR